MQEMAERGDRLCVYMKIGDKQVALQSVAGFLPMECFELTSPDDGSTDPRNLDAISSRDGGRESLLETAVGAVDLPRIPPPVLRR